MLKNILKLEGAHVIKKQEQRSINGGITLCPGGALACSSDADCPFHCPCTKPPGSLCGFCLSPNP